MSPPADEPATFAWGKDPEAVAFACSLCDQPAGTIKLTPAGELMIDGLVCRLTQRIASAEDVARVRAILVSRDARALYALDAEWASFYCPTCDRVYCAAHWRLDVRYDDDFPGWYDSTYGTCPAGHRRLVDD